MKTVLMALLLLCCLGLLLWFLGPRYTISSAPSTPPDLPEDLDQFLAQSESAVPELKEGVEKTILWAHEDQRITEFAIVYLHGFSSSRREISPTFEKLASEIGANVFFTRMVGHGTLTGELMRSAQRDDWMLDALEARAIGHRIGKNLIIAGTSQGGLLANWVATVPSEQWSKPAALVLFTPNYAPYDSRTNLLLKPWGRQVLPLIFGSHRHWEPQNSGHTYYWNTRYPVQALFPMMAQVDYITPTYPAKNTFPTLVFYSEQDTAVLPSAVRSAFEAYPTPVKELVAIENSGDMKNHILAGEILSPQTTDTVVANILDFLIRNQIVSQASQ